MATKKKKQEKPVEPAVVEVDEDGARTIAYVEPADEETLAAEEKAWSMATARSTMPMTPVLNADDYIAREYPFVNEKRQDVIMFLKAILRETVKARFCGGGLGGRYNG